ncbi:MAG TPA: 3-oxoacyl-[acyl-carrier-protein] reductase [Candidatus Omnitrophica bacterium]|nr:3-oxoacyl-[acyl-carrier-protein] reductase [Candidatus Omnitrophota bacterium]
MRLKDKISLVTGAAQGIGRAIALKFADEGSDVVLIDVNREKCGEVAKQIESKRRKSWAYELDVSDYRQVEELLKGEIPNWGRIDILINNAGITRDNLILRMKEEEWDDVIRINLKGAFNFCKVVSRYMMKQRSGVIVNIASVIGIIGNAGQVNYAASKAGIIGVTKTLAKELASRNIRVNAVAPGFIETPMTERLTEERKQRMLEAIPLGRIGSPEEVAKVVLFLATDESSYITGQVINIDGGMVM